MEGDTIAQYPRHIQNSLLQCELLSTKNLFFCGTCVNSYSVVFPETVFSDDHITWPLDLQLAIHVHVCTCVYMFTY